MPSFIRTASLVAAFALTAIGCGSESSGAPSTPAEPPPASPEAIPEAVPSPPPDEPPAKSVELQSRHGWTFRVSLGHIEFTERFLADVGSPAPPGQVYMKAVLNVMNETDRDAEASESKGLPVALDVPLGLMEGQCSESHLDIAHVVGEVCRFSVSSLGSKEDIIPAYGTYQQWVGSAQYLPQTVSSSDVVVRLKGKRLN